MKLNVSQIVEIYEKMKSNHVVIYGAGKNGVRVHETLIRHGFEVDAVADRVVGRGFYKHKTVSLSTLCDGARNQVCIISLVASVPEIRELLENYFDVVIDDDITRWMDYFVPEGWEGLTYEVCVPFNHYESPYPNEEDLIYAKRMVSEDHLVDVNLNVEKQLELAGRITPYCSEYKKWIHSGEKTRYQNNTWYGEGDAALLHGMMREFKPQRIVEIGSGFSTCVMLDTNERWMNGDVSISCIEPRPQRLHENLIDYDNNKIFIYERNVQDVPLRFFEELEENDFLFIDSSHVAKAGGDVLYEYFQILPALRKGVVIHIHDIVYPFYYPEGWIRQGRAYNEAYIVRALLSGNSTYQVTYFNHYMSTMQRDVLTENDSKGIMCDGGTSLWLKKNDNTKIG